MALGHDQDYLLSSNFEVLNVFTNCCYGRENNNNNNDNKKNNWNISIFSPAELENLNVCAKKYWIILRNVLVDLLFLPMTNMAVMWLYYGSSSGLAVADLRSATSTGRILDRLQSHHTAPVNQWLCTTSSTVHTCSQAFLYHIDDMILCYWHINHLSRCCEICCRRSGTHPVW